jgi:hypothetical protein
MSETLTEVRDELTEPKVTEPNNPFLENNWGENTEPVIPEIKEVIKEEVKPVEWWKDLDFESADEAKLKVTELKKLKETPSPENKEIEFANENSRKFFDYVKEGKEEDVFNYLSEKRQLDKFVNAEVSETNAGDIVKLAMQQRHKDLTPEEIDYKFNKQFSAGKIPEQKETETDYEFEIRQAEYNERAEDLKKELKIEAKLAKPELEKLKSELILPNIQKEGNTEAANLQNQKDQEEIDKRRDVYLKALSNDFKNFNGYDTSYKSEGVEIPVSYTVTEEEKASLKNELESFDLDGFVLSRWFNEDGSPNVKGLMRDVYLLRNEEKVHQKIANESGAKVLDNYIKNAKNISVTGGNPAQFNLSGEKTEVEKMSGFFAGM